jgi:hypothetical protein
MQLVAYGAQDIYLTGNPQITFFKIVYRRHTAYSMESIEQTFNGSADWGKKVSCTISRNGDLIHRTYLQATLPEVTLKSGSAPTGGEAAFRWLDWVGHVMIKSVELEIGGQRIDKHYAAWLHIWNELTQSAGHALGYANMVGNTPDLTGTKIVPSTAALPTVVKGKTLYIPLQFWFCRNPGLALPLIALQYHEVKINLEIANVEDCYWSGTRATVGTGAWSSSSSVVASKDLALGSTSLFVDYIYLDTEERRRFAQVSHEYLIEQLQFTGDESTTSSNVKVKLNFNHPCKELIWVVQPDDLVGSGATQGKEWFNFTDSSTVTGSNSIDINAGAAGGNNTLIISAMADDGQNPVTKAKLQLNGHDRFAERDGRYFNLVQPYQHHTNIPAKGINVYSFALLPEEHQPSGTCNMSRIDNATLLLTLSENTLKTNGGNTVNNVIATSQSARIKVYAVNYNVLRIMSGMGGLAYSD